MGIIQKQSFYASLVLGVGMLIGFFTSGYLLPNYLTEEQNGLLTLLNSYALIYSQVALMGISTMIIRYYPIVKEKKHKKPAFLLFVTLIGLAGFLIFMLFYYFTKGMFKHVFATSPLFRQFYFLLLPLTFATLFFYIYDAFATAIQKTVSGFILKDVIQRLLILLAVVVYIFYTTSFTSFMGLYTLAWVLPTVFLFFILIKSGHWSFHIQGVKAYREHYRDMAKVSGYSFLLGLTYVGVTNVDAIMIERYLSLEQAGIYGRNMFFGVLVALPYRILHKSASGQLSSYFAHNQMNRVKDIYYKSCINQWVLGLFLFCLIWINIDNVYQLIPASYASGKYVIFFIGLGNLLNMLGGVNTAVISFSPYYRWNTYLVASLLLLIIITNMAMIPLWGITGAALATALSLGFYNFSMYSLLLIRYKFQPFDLRYLWVLIFGILGMVLCAATPPLPHYLWDIPVRSALFALVFLSLILLTKISPDINGFVDFLFKKVLRK